MTSFESDIASRTTSTLASPNKRVVAKVIDVVLIVAFGVMIAFATGDQLDLSGSVGAESPSEGAVYGFGDLVFNAFNLLAVAAYYWLMTSMRSATVGKLVMGIRVVRANDRSLPLGLSDGLKRTLNHVLTATWGVLTGIVLYFVANDGVISSVPVWVAVGSIVVNLLSGLLGLVSLIRLLDAKQQHQTVMDSFANTLVINKPPAGSITNQSPASSIIR